MLVSAHDFGMEFPHGERRREFSLRRPWSPRWFDRAVMALTTRLPANWPGLRLAILLRRFVTMRHAIRCLRRRALGPAYAAASARQWLREERPVHAADVRPCRSAPRSSARSRTHVPRVGRSCSSISAPMSGLYSLFVAAHAGAQARILAIRTGARHLRAPALQPRSQSGRADPAAMRWRSPTTSARSQSSSTGATAAARARVNWSERRPA